jgi:hypothetical protein
MSSGMSHYRKAEQLLNRVDELSAKAGGHPTENIRAIIEAAQAHAALALVAAQWDSEWIARSERGES